MTPVIQFSDVTVQPVDGQLEVFEPVSYAALVPLDVSEVIPEGVQRDEAEPPRNPTTRSYGQREVAAEKVAVVLAPEFQTTPLVPIEALTAVVLQLAVEFACVPLYQTALVFVALVPVVNDARALVVTTRHDARAADVVPALVLMLVNPVGLPGAVVLPVRNSYTNTVDPTGAELLKVHVAAAPATEHTPPGAPLICPSAAEEKATRTKNRKTLLIRSP